MARVQGVRGRVNCFSNDVLFQWKVPQGADKILSCTMLALCTVGRDR
jgi:hypothetical protein